MEKYVSNNMNLNQDPLQNLAQHVAFLQKRVSELDSRLETNNERLMGLAKASKERFDRMQSIVASLDFSNKKAMEDLRIELAKVTGLVTQKRVVDSKLEEVLRNHTHLVSQMEMRIQELKKLLNAQSMKVTSIESKLTEL